MNFVKQTMNVIDILAIAPYYISLVFEDPNIGLPADEELQQTAAANTTVTEAEVDKSDFEHEHSRNIVSGHRQWRRIRQCVPNSASVEDSEGHEDLQAGQEVHRAAGHGPHHEEELQAGGGRDNDPDDCSDDE